VPIYIFHIFYDAGYFLSFDGAQEYVRKNVIRPTTQTFYAPSGATTKKDIFKFWYTLTSPLGMVTREPTLTARFIKDKNGHILPYVFFSGGRLELSAEILGVLRGRNK
jgi:hypothetical protein